MPKRDWGKCSVRQHAQLWAKIQEARRPRLRRIRNMIKLIDAALKKGEATLVGKQQSSTHTEKKP